VNVELGYEPLANVLQEALAQAATGKGKERHANGKPILEQPIMVKSRESGPGGPFFQASKKLLEALNCLDDERAIRDLLGAINYTAAMVLLRREGQEKYLRENAAGQVYAGILLVTAAKMVLVNLAVCATHAPRPALTTKRRCSLQKRRISPLVH